MSVLLALVLGLNGTALAARGVGTKLIRYHGYRLSVPKAWPVYALTADPTVCVRFNRHALYLGPPSARQRCPASAIGRTEAILVSPLAGHDAGAGGAGPALPLVTRAGAESGQGSGTRFVVAAHGVTVTATWGRYPGVIRRALGARLVATARAAPASAEPSSARQARSARASAHQAAVYTGLGFDACSAPSLSQMLAWGASPYRALGVYIGGTNMACSQDNLTAAWVSAESAAGWQLIPTYVGFQAPTNSCGCAGITPSQAASQGSAAAADAITQAQALGIGQGNPIYFDMEAYSRTAVNTSAVLTFLSAWSTALHAAGYLSGTYSSSASGISDLVAEYGTGFAEPDDIWDASWNGLANTADPSYVPVTDWASHQRLHQYQGAHNATYGGVQINIDSDYVDGATAGTGQGPLVIPVPTVAAAPVLTVSPHADGSITLLAGWTGATDVAGWQVLAGANPQALTPLNAVSGSGASAKITVRDAFPYFAVQGLGSGGQALGTSPAVATPADVAIYGHSAFVSPRGIGGVPVGCLTAAACQIAGTVTAGRKTLASTGPEWVPAGGGVLQFALTTAGRRLLARAGSRRLPVQIAAHAVGGPAATAMVNLIPFVTSGRGPRRVLHGAPALRFVGKTDFVSTGAGGLLAGCSGSASCVVQTSIRAANTTIATGGPERLGANEIGYLLFQLTPGGRALLAAASGDQLGAYATISQPGATAHAALALVGFR
jgi:hypothetical protein